MPTITAKVIDEKQAASIIAAVKRTGILSVYRRWYEYFRPKLIGRFDKGSITTPYAPSSLGKRKRSGEIIQQTPASLYNRDTDALYKSIVDDVKISETTIEIRSDVPYAGFALKRFEEKGGLAPDGLLKIEREDIEALELYLLEEYEDALGEIPDDLI